MIVAVASGKGGTGKTTFAVNLAESLARSPAHEAPVRLLDCDVEAPNAGLFVDSRPRRVEPVEVPRPVWDADSCTGCGRCAEACRYNALAVVKGRVLLLPEMCHACGVCGHVCPEGALSEQPAPIGRVTVRRVRPGFLLVEGELNVGEAMAPRVVRAVKAHAAPEAVTIVDAAPGTTCPVVSALEGADVVVLVTEPTPFGLHDLKLAAALASRLGLPVGIVVNRSDGRDAPIADWAAEAGIPIVGRIPFRRDYAEAYSRGELLIDADPALAEALLGTFERARSDARRPAPAVEDEQSFPLQPTAGAAREGCTAGSHAELAVISGKGGTGKTTVTAGLAPLLGPKALADCDVDAADLHLLLKPRVRAAEPFVGGQKAQIDPALCTGCGRCAEACHFGAVERHHEGGADADVRYRVRELDCEGCGLCAHVCPADAVRLTDRVTGLSFESETDCGPMSHARLGVAMENSGKLVMRVRDRAAALAASAGARLVLGDGPPGTGCPAIASVSGADAVLIVTEPTVSGVHDLERALALAAHFGAHPLVCINKCDLNPEQADRARRLAAGRGAPVVGEIPFDPAVNEALKEGRILTEAGDGPAATAVRALARRLGKELPGRVRAQRSRAAP